MAAGVLCAAPAAVAAQLLPDLVADRPVGGNQPLVYGDGQDARLLLRMDGFVHNRGEGPLEIRGSDPSAGVMGTVRQRVYDSGGGFDDLAHVPAPTLIYETDDDHRHWHLRHAMRYSLWSADRTAQVGPSQKVGFCLLDSERVEAPPAPPVYTPNANGFCRSDQPSAASVHMGVSAGWRDIYSYLLAFQWIDISDVAPGHYWLRADADPDGVVAETNEVNAAAYAAEASTVNGHLAKPVAAGHIPLLGTTAVTLAATTFDDLQSGSPGPRQFRIVTPPAGGTLDQPPGTWFSGPQVHYTPNLGFSGADSFTVAARDASSPFPRNPPSAAVTLTVGGAPDPGGGVIGISGAPQSVYTSSQTQLRASGPGIEQGVTWRVDGIDGGSSGAGTISAGGLYRAPASPPPAGGVTIGANSATGATGHVSIRVAKTPRRRAAPTLKAPRVPRRGLSRIRLGRHKRSLLAVVSSAQTGRVRFIARRDGKRFGYCSMIVGKGGAATCKMRIPTAAARRTLLRKIPRTVKLNLPSVVVSATLTRRGKIVSRRRARAR